MIAEPLPPLLDRLSPRERARVLLRGRIVHDLEMVIFKGKRAGHLARDIITTYIALLAKRRVYVTARTLGNWRRRYRLEGIAGLIDKRKLQQPPGKGTDRSGVKRPSIDN